jgi:hypothetical protein
MTDLNRYTISLETVNLKKVLSTWIWLTGEDKTIIAITIGGDAVLKDPKNNLYFLDVGGGELILISDNYLDFTEDKLSAEDMEELLLIELIAEMNHEDMKLAPGQVFSYTLLPLLGEAYDGKNMLPVDLYEHFSLAGEMHYKMKD